VKSLSVCVATSLSFTRPGLLWFRNEPVGRLIAAQSNIELTR
jgi:hypothetical protein